MKGTIITEPRRIVVAAVCLQLLPVVLSAQAQQDSSKTNGRPSAFNGSGESMTWKCRCGASVLPLFPSEPSTWPALSRSPGFTATDPVFK